MLFNNINQLNHLKI